MIRSEYGDFEVVGDKSDIYADFGVIVYSLYKHKVLSKKELIRVFDAAIKQAEETEREGK